LRSKSVTTACKPSHGDQLAVEQPDYLTLRTVTV
jgi:hypothetical protein